MDVIFMFIIGFVVLLLAIIAVIRAITHRIHDSGKEVKEKINHLEKRIDELEREKD